MHWEEFAEISFGNNHFVPLPAVGILLKSNKCPLVTSVRSFAEKLHVHFTGNDGVQVVEGGYELVAVDMAELMDNVVVRQTCIWRDLDEWVLYGLDCTFA